MAAQSDQRKLLRRHFLKKPDDAKVVLAKAGNSFKKKASHYEKLLYKK